MNSLRGGGVSKGEPIKMPITSPDIRRMGYLKKLKTMKKKLFILRDRSEGRSARLEYYNEKKLKPNSTPKRTILLHDCFSISKKQDAKHKYVITLFTRDDCFSLACENEDEQEAWLANMLELHLCCDEEGSQPRCMFEHVWQVTIKPKGIGNGKNLIPGPYRLCLTNKELSLVRRNQDEPDIIFQLGGIRRCGHTDCFFFMEVGRSAMTGEGELWMEVEDSVIAQNMHEVILSSMKSTTNSSDQSSFRPRSRSSVSDRSTKPAGVASSRGASPGFESSTLPKRSKTISYSDHPGSPPQARLRLSSGKSSRSSSSLGRGHSPVTITTSHGHNFSDMHRQRTDSLESHGSHGTTSSISADELDLSPMEHNPSSGSSTRSLTPECLHPLVEMNYLAMSPPHPKDIFFGGRGGDGEEQVDYMDMKASATPGSLDEYLPMSPGTPIGDDGYLECASNHHSTSPAMSSSSRDTDDHHYLDMTPLAHSLPTVEERLTDGGYLDMLPGKTSGAVASGPLSRPPKLRPDKVCSYLSDDGSVDEFPKRAYSVGSKPSSTKNKSHTGYVDMTAKELSKAAVKSSSAPHLPDKDRDQSQNGGKSSGRGKGKDGSRLEAGRRTETDRLFMEMDFFRNELSSNLRPRTSSAGRHDLGSRPRVSSFGNQDAQRPRTSSFGKDSLKMAAASAAAVSRTGSMNRHEAYRQRTATICQDSFRNRTSSFGSADMRPRSSSHGNARYRQQRITSSHDSSRHSSSESLRRLANRSSTESLRSNQSTTSNEYLSMGPHSPASSHASSRVHDIANKVGTNDSGYIPMEPGSGESSHKPKDMEPARAQTPSKRGSLGRGVHLRIPSSDSTTPSSKSASASTVSKSKMSFLAGEYIDITASKPPVQPKDAYMDLSFGKGPPKSTHPKDVTDDRIHADANVGTSSSKKESKSVGSVIKNILPHSLRDSGGAKSKQTHVTKSVERPSTAVSSGMDIEDSYAVYKPGMNTSISPPSSSSLQTVISPIQDNPPQHLVLPNQAATAKPHEYVNLDHTGKGGKRPVVSTSTAGTQKVKLPARPVCEISHGPFGEVTSTWGATPLMSYNPAESQAEADMGAVGGLMVTDIDAATMATPAPGTRTSYIEPADSETQDIPRNASYDPMNEPPMQLNYASLDLSSSSEDFQVYTERGGRSPVSGRPLAPGETKTPLQYAKIDFMKLESIRNSGNATQAPSSPREAPQVVSEMK